MLARAQVAVRCAWRSSIDRHFQRRIHPSEESGLRAHLTGCPLCRRRYDRHLLLAALLPGRPEDTADRLATGLGLRTVRAPALGTPWPLSDWRWVVAGMTLGLGTVTLVLWAPDRASGDAAGKAAYTVAETVTDTVADSVTIFRSTSDGLAEFAGGAVAPDVRLVFAVRNERWRYLTIAGLDQAGAVHLLSPTRAIARTPGLQLLPERGLPGVQGPLFRIVALLTDGPLGEDPLDGAVRETLPASAGVRIEIVLTLRPR